MAQPSVHGRFIWQELMSTDTAGATTFYARIVGWRVQAPLHPSSDYHVFAAESGSVGGVMSLPEDARKMGAHPHWLPYIGAESVDATVADTERLGGKVLRPAEDIENLGRYAVLADPQGATFGIYRPLHPAASAAKSQPQRGEFCWQELATSDHEAAFRFYSALFGWEALQRMDMGPAGTYLIFGRDGVQHGGLYKVAAQTPAPYWLSYVEVPDTDAAAQLARDAGGRVTNGPMDVPGGGRIAQLLDPSGVLFAVHTAAREAPARTRKAAQRNQGVATGSAAKPAAASPAAESVSAAAAGRAQSAKRAAKKAAKKATGKAAKKAAGKAPGKVAVKTAKKTAKKAAKRTGKKTAKTRPKTTAKKSARTAAKRPAGKTGKVAKKARGRAAPAAKRSASAARARRGAGSRGR